MTPKEKAKSLFETFSCDGDIRNGVAVVWAIACCDEVIQSHEEAKDEGNLKSKWAIIFWQSVKTEIEKL